MGAYPLFWLLCAVAVIIISEVKSKSIPTDPLTSEAHTPDSKIHVCGTPDYDDINFSNHSRVRRYTYSGKRWYKPQITYRVLNGPSYPHGLHNVRYRRTNKLNKKKVESLVTRAFNEWAPYTGLKFVQVSNGVADITLSFETGNHGHRQNAFDGPSGTLAHSGHPSNRGVKIHFDNEETWVIDSYNEEAIPFYPIALHEIGHALGLRHSDVKEAIMYKHFNKEMHLNFDDAIGMVAIYGVVLQSIDRVIKSGREYAVITLHKP